MFLIHINMLHKIHVLLNVSEVNMGIDVLSSYMNTVVLRKPLKD